MRIKIEKRNLIENSNLNLIKEISDTFNISQKTSELLVSRGINSVKEAEQFIFFSKDDLHDPFLLSSMDIVTERILLAVKNAEKIVVFGDYDADGICGAYILVKTIRKLGGDVSPYIPNRSEGYGLNIQAINEIIECYNPSLIITCDLGISCFEEIEYIKSKGIDVLVSDHHELPKVLPNCPKINPKLDEGKYPFIDLCGAGVAFKISQALLPDYFMQLVEFAAIATVADSVILKGENRLIVKLGLEKLSKNPNKSLKILMEECGVKGEITSTTIAFVLAPRINASGRIGVALRSLNMFLSENEKEIKKLVSDINSDNLLRQKYCEQFFQEGYKMFIQNPERRACILKSPTWQSGLLGIVASKLSEDFCRPTILFSINEDTLRGSGRSIPGINMFEMLSSMSHLFITFGGHSQACGLTIAKDNFELFNEAVEKYLEENVPLTAFLPTSEYDISESEIKPSLQFIKQLNVLEPYGVGNPRPIFLRYESSIEIDRMKSFPQHLVGLNKFSELLAFSQGKYLEVMQSSYNKALFIDYSINCFKGKESLRGSIKDFFTLPMQGELNNEEELNNFLFSMTKIDLQKLEMTELCELCAKEKFGILIVCATAQGYRHLTSFMSLSDFLIETNAIVVKSNINRVLFSPKTAINFDKFEKIIFVEDMLDASLIINQTSKFFTVEFNGYLKEIALKKDRDTLGIIFKEFKKLNGAKVISYKNILQNQNLKAFSSHELMLAYAIFKELGLIHIENYKARVDSSKKVELSQSELFNKLIEN